MDIIIIAVIMFSLISYFALRNFMLEELETLNRNSGLVLLAAIPFGIAVFLAFYIGFIITICRIPQTFLETKWN